MESLDIAIFTFPCVGSAITMRLLLLGKYKFICFDFYFVKLGYIRLFSFKSIFTLSIIPAAPFLLPFPLHSVSPPCSPKEFHFYICVIYIGPQMTENIAFDFLRLT